MLSGLTSGVRQAFYLASPLVSRRGPYLVRIAQCMLCKGKFITQTLLQLACGLLMFEVLGSTRYTRVVWGEASIPEGWPAS